MMSGSTTSAAYYREHRAAFELALEMDCTPAEAQAEMGRRAARVRWERTSKRLATKLNGLPVQRSACQNSTEETERQRREDQLMMRN